MKNLNYKIQDWFEHPDFGVIVSIANPKLDKLSNDEIKNKIGNRIVILDNYSLEQELIEVHSVEIASSLIGKKNVHICLGNSVKLSNIAPDSSIIILDKEENIEVAEKSYKSRIT